MRLGYTVQGQGVIPVMVMHDWFCDQTSYKDMVPELDFQTFTYVFVDLRGYGKSRVLAGECTVEEATADIMAVADHLRWPTFHLIGHSMSGLIAQWAALKHPDRIKSVVAITPVPACGRPVPEDVFAFLKDAAGQNDESAQQIVGFMTGHRHSSDWVQHKVQQWRQSAEPQARVAYLHMFTETNFADAAKGLKTSFLVVGGEHDAEAYQEAALKETFLKWYPNAQLKVCPKAGHYPMQENPKQLGQIIEDFLRSQPA